jgi:POT family proton-dependent oligopeptide transporter
LLFLKKLKKLTHGAEEKEMEGLEAEGFELADEDVK